MTISAGGKGEAIIARAPDPGQASRAQGIVDPRPEDAGLKSGPYPADPWCNDALCYRKATMYVLEPSHSALPIQPVTDQVVPTKLRPDAPPSTSRGSADRVEIGSGAHPGSTLEVSGTELEYQRRDRASLFIQTDDGDMVDLVFRARTSLSLESSSFETPDAAGTRLALSSRASSDLSVRVKGHLDAEELVAVQEAIDRASSLVAEFFEGGTEDAFRTAAELGLSGAELTKVKLRMRSQEKLTYSALTVRQDAAVTPAARVPEDVPTAPDAAASGGAAASGAERIVAAAKASPGQAGLEPAGKAGDAAPPSNPSGAGAQPMSPKPISELGGATGQEGPGESSVTVGEAGAPGPDVRAQAIQAIGDFLGRLVDAFAQPAHESRWLSFSSQVRIFEQTLITLSSVRSETPSDRPEPDDGMMGGAAPEPEADDVLPPLIGETLDALVAARSQPMDKVA